MKKVIKETKKEIATIDIERVDENYIYAFKDIGNVIYKAHRVSDDDEYAFIEMATSNCYANGVFPSLQDLIEITVDEGDEVFEFSDLEEFLEWSLKEVR